MSTLFETVSRIQTGTKLAVVVVVLGVISVAVNEQAGKQPGVSASGRAAPPSVRAPAPYPTAASNQPPVLPNPTTAPRTAVRGERSAAVDTTASRPIAPTSAPLAMERPTPTVYQFGRASVSETAPPPLPTAARTILLAEQRNINTCLSGRYPALCNHAALSAEMRAQVREAERLANLGMCSSGRYPALCNYSLLSDAEHENVREAERQENLRTCLTGRFPALCRQSLLTQNELQNTKQAEREDNLRTCLTGRFPALCRRSLLTADQTRRTDEAEREENLRTCMTGRFPALCRYSLLTSAEAVQVRAAEREENLRTCLNGRYPVLCKHSLLTREEAAAVVQAESTARAANKSRP